MNCPYDDRIEPKPPQPMQGVPNGYKQTETGIIPEDWKNLSVGSQGEVLTGKALAAHGPGPNRPYLRTTNVFDGRIAIDDVLSMPMTDEQFSRFMIRLGDVLLNEGQSLDLVGRCAIYRGEYPEPCAMQNQLIRFRARPGVSGEFASHLFRHCQHTGVFARIALQTTSIAHLGSKRFEELRLAWPPDESEQSAIASALSDVDALIAKLDQLIAKKRDLKQAAMQELLTGRRRLPGFSGEWQPCQLGSVIQKLEAGVSLNSIDQSTSIEEKYILKTSAVFNGRFLPHECKIIAPSEVHRARVSPERDTLIISRMNTPDLVGEIGYVDSTVTNLFLPDRLWLAKVLSAGGTSTRWLSYLLSSSRYKDQIKSLATGTSGSMKNISKEKLFSLTVLFPAASEQTAIATVLSDMDTEITALEARRDKTKLLKEGMMQELLTGRIRLV